MNDAEYDLLIRAGRIVCPATRIDGPGAVGIRSQKIVTAGADISGTARQTLDFPQSMLLPGFIDLHAHPAEKGSKYGVDPDVHFLTRGVTTVLSQGDAGALNWPDYQRTTVDGSRTRVRLAINLSAPGESMPGGCLEQLEWADVDACVNAIERAGEDIWGIAVNVSRVACGSNDPRELVRRARIVAERTGRPLLYGVREPKDWPFDDQLAQLKPGDVLTYCFRYAGWSIIDGTDVHPAVRDARERGVLFDVGHGMASFDFPTAEAAIAADFPPDTISTDQYARHIGSNPQHDLPRTMSKLLAAGMPESDVFAAVTVRPASILGLDSETGALAPGMCADLTVLNYNDAAAPLVDTNGNTRGGGCWEPVCTVRAGAVV